MTEQRELPKSWRKAWELGREFAGEGYTLKDSYYAMDGDLLEWICSDAELDAFYRAGFNGREPELVEAIRYGEVPECGRSINYADNSWEDGVSCVTLIREESDRNYKSLYDVTLGWAGRERITVSGWYLGGSGSDGEPLIWGAKKIEI